MLLVSNGTLKKEGESKREREQQPCYVRRVKHKGNLYLARHISVVLHGVGSANLSIISKFTCTFSASGFKCTKSCKYTSLNRAE